MLKFISKGFEVKELFKKIKIIGLL